MFLHSFGLDSGAARWLTTPTDLSPTLPNHGARRRQRNGLSLIDMVDEIAGWVASPVHVVGCSVGGMVALHLALEHPDLVRSLVLACTAASVPAEAMIARAQETRSMTRAAFIDTTMQRWFTERALSDSPTPPVEYARACLARADRDALADVWTAVAQHDVESRLGEISVPTTCIGATMDVSAPLARTHELSAGIARSRVRTIDSAHMAYLEHPAEFSGLVDEHLRWASPEDGPTAPVGT